MAFRLVVRLAVVAPLLSCVGRASRPASAPLARHPSGPCPVIPDSTPHDSVRAAVAKDSSPHLIIRDGPTGPAYVSILVDGQWAAWNEGKMVGPDLDPNDISRLDVLQASAAHREYGTCPGVGLIIIQTKSKSWRPYSHDST